VTDPVLPVIDDVNRPFWDGAAVGELRFQRCTACGHVRYPISPICPRCLEAGTEWIVASGRGSVLSFVVFERAYHPSRADAIPYAVALVQTEEGPRMFSDLPPGDEASVAVGDPVEVAFEATGDIVVPRFRLRQS
jgi:uncharacterized OB-fold protein